MKPTRKSPRRLLAASTLAAVIGAGVSQAATVAYYRFEEGAIGAVPSGTAPAPNAVVDSAGGDDNMNAFNAASAPLYSATVPNATIPQTGAANTRSLNFVSNDDVYTSTGGPLMTTAFSSFTLEAYVNFSSLAGFQTIVGRDDSGNPGQGLGPQSLFYFQKGNDNNFRIELITNNNLNLQVNSTSAALQNTWYHLAAVGNATAGSLELFVNGASVGSSTGFTGLYDPNPDTGWTIGRGQFNGANGDFVNGFIDEVRFSDTALPTSQFLNAVPEPSALLLGSLGALVLLRRRR